MTIFREFQTNFKVKIFSEFWDEVSKTILPLNKVQWLLCYHLDQHTIVKSPFHHCINQNRAQKLPAAGVIPAVSTGPPTIEKLVSSKQAHISQ
jgi:hypothetical protein